jgi:hypothetical protein
LLFIAMALGPGLVLAVVAGSVFCPLTPSRRLHCLLRRYFRPLLDDGLGFSWTTRSLSFGVVP